MNNEMPEDLSEQQLSSALSRTVASLCDLKFKMDLFARNDLGQPFLYDWIDSNGNGVLHGNELLFSILPFIDWEALKPARIFKAYVNPSHVLGASIEGLPEDIKPNEVAARIARYSTEFGSFDNASYRWIKPIGIFCAHEGKHRVAFMRAHKQSRIAAWVWETAYPAADRLIIIRPTCEYDEWFVLLDGRYLQVLRRPRIARQLLEAYGVKTLPWYKIPNAPDEHKVREEIYRRKLHLNIGGDERQRTLDLDIIRQQSQDSGETVAKSLVDLELYSLNWPRFIIILAVCVIFGGVLAGSEWAWMHDAGLMILGVGGGLAIALHVIQLFGPGKQN